MKINKLLAFVVVSAFALPAMAQNAPNAAPPGNMAAPYAAMVVMPAHKHHQKYHFYHHAEKASTGQINTVH
ncbi:MAG: hypothetical protein H7240_09615 [Glaciimonas sp.]|nr:hypothetical protein [Glaciimonas sp.]